LSESRIVVAGRRAPSWADIATPGSTPVAATPPSHARRVIEESFIGIASKAARRRTWARPGPGPASGFHAEVVGSADAIEGHVASAGTDGRKTWIDVVGRE
jgi:hypothetical protein